MKTNRLPILQHPFISALVTRFRHRPRTDMATGHLTNKDFIILALFAYGPFGLQELRKLALAWRGDCRILDAYFTPHYGHTATDVRGKVRFGGRYCSSNAAKIKKCWYRSQMHRQAVRFPGCWVPMQRYANDLSLLGLARARALLQVPTNLG